MLVECSLAGINGRREAPIEENSDIFRMLRQRPDEIFQENSNLRTRMPAHTITKNEAIATHRFVQGVNNRFYGD